MTVKSPVLNAGNRFHLSTAEKIFRQYSGQPCHFCPEQIAETLGVETTRKGKVIRQEFPDESALVSSEESHYWCIGFTGKQCRDPDLQYLVAREPGRKDKPDPGFEIPYWYDGRMPDHIENWWKGLGQHDHPTTAVQLLHDYRQYHTYSNSREDSRRMVRDCLEEGGHKSSWDKWDADRFQFPDGSALVRFQGIWQEGFSVDECRDSTLRKAFRQYRWWHEEKSLPWQPYEELGLRYHLNHEQAQMLRNYEIVRQGPYHCLLSDVIERMVAHERSFCPLLFECPVQPDLFREHGVNQHNALMELEAITENPNFISIADGKGGMRMNRNGVSPSRVETLASKFEEAGIETDIWQNYGRMRVYLTLPREWLVPEGWSCPVAGVRSYLEYLSKEDIEMALKPHDGQTKLTTGTSLKIIVNTGRGEKPDAVMKKDIEQRMKELQFDCGIETPKGDKQIAIDPTLSQDKHQESSLDKNEQAKSVINSTP